MHLFAGAKKEACELESCDSEHGHRLAFFGGEIFPRALLEEESSEEGARRSPTKLICPTNKVDILDERENLSPRRRAPLLSAGQVSNVCPAVHPLVVAQQFRCKRKRVDKSTRLAID